ncbi:transposase [Mesorhizobium japonicum R7A]|nr:transposase [Mesorhizobium japonicum R7A]
MVIALGERFDNRLLKIHALVDAQGRPIKLLLTAGQKSDIASAADLIADKGYDANALRAAITERNAWANIPPKANRKDPICFSPFLYKARNLVERFLNKAKQFRRIATRYDKLATT